MTMFPIDYIKPAERTAPAYLRHLADREHKIQMLKRFLPDNLKQVLDSLLEEV